MGWKDRTRGKVGKKPQAKRFLVVVEGKVTEPQYLEAVKRSRQMKSLEVQIESGHTDPIGIVNQAKSRIREANKADPFDEVWCVFDVEAKLTQQARFGLRPALDAARRSRISCAVSNPCFELWLLWHSIDRNAWISSDEAQRLCAERGLVDRGGRKHILDADNLIKECYQAARDRARNSEGAFIRNLIVNAEDRNPSSTVFNLVDSILLAFPERK